MDKLIIPGKLDVKMRAGLLPVLWFVISSLGLSLLILFTLYWTGILDFLSGLEYGIPEVLFGVLIVNVTGGCFVILGSRFIIRFFLKAKLLVAPDDTKLQQLLIIIEQQSVKAKIKPPRLAIYDSHELNAFAVGSGRQNSILVISRSLIEALTLDELSAVVGHEITHIANGDMLALCLMQGAINMWVEYPSKFFNVVINKVFPWEVYRQLSGKLFYLTLLCCFGGLAQLFVMWFSRNREFRADAGGARLAGHAEMMAALRTLQTDSKAETVFHPFAVLGLNDNVPYLAFLQVFTSHPPLSERIKALSRLQ